MLLLWCLSCLHWLYSTSFWLRYSCFGPVFFAWPCFHKWSDSLIKPWHYLDGVPFDFYLYFVQFLHILEWDNFWKGLTAPVLYMLEASKWPFIDKSYSVSMRAQSMSKTYFSSWFLRIHTQTMFFVRVNHLLFPKWQKWKAISWQRQCPFSLSKSIDPPWLWKREGVKVSRNQSRQPVIFKDSHESYLLFPQTSFFYKATWTGVWLCVTLWHWIVRRTWGQQRRWHMIGSDTNPFQQEDP